MMLAHSGEFYFLPYIPFLIFWVVVGAYMVVLGVRGITKSPFCRRDSLYLGGLPFLFGAGSLAWFFLSKWPVDFSLLRWLAGIPTLLGLFTMFRPVSKAPPAESGRRED